MSDRPCDLFGETPPRDLPPAAIAALRAPSAAELIAGIQLADGFARIFRPRGDAAGKAATVDAARLFGSVFTNVARRHLAAAADLRGDVELPLDLRPDPREVAIHKQKLASAFLDRLPALESYLREEASA